MKFALVSDTHLLGRTPTARLDDTAKTSMVKFSYVIDYAWRHQGSVIIAGDMFDVPRNWFTLLRAMTIIRRHEVPIYSIFGQHDTYMYNEKNRRYTCLGALAKAKYVTVLEPDRIKLTWRPDEVPVNLYGVHFTKDREIPEVPEDEKDEYNILVIHAPIAEQALFPNHQYIDAGAFIRKHNDFDIILCGDTHRYFMKQYKGSYILNTGPMVRKSAKQYNFKHEPCFFWYDTEEPSLDVHVIPHEPAEDVLTRDHIESENETNEMLREFIDVIANDDIDTGTDLVKNIYTFIKINGITKDVSNIISEVMAKHGES